MSDDRRPIVLRVTFPNRSAGRGARASLCRMGAAVRTLLAPSGAFVLEVLTDPYSRPRVEGVVWQRGGTLAHVRSPAPARRDEDYI